MCGLIPLSQDAWARLVNWPKLPIPNDTRLIGSTTYLQWAVVDPAAAGLGLAFSNGGKLTL